MIESPIAIIDIGSNSIRMVVYDGLSRSPSILFNERVLAELGKTLSTTGTLNPETLELAYYNLQRFKAVIHNMKAQYFVVATAALREASDGPAFTQKLRDELGLDVQIISGDEEARLGVMGLLAAWVDVNGVVGDLGGGSLELSYVENSQYIQGSSLPLGGLRLISQFQQKRKKLQDEIDQNIQQLSGLKDVACNKAFYPIGGAWRAIARYYMEKTGYPIHLIHGLKVKSKDLMPYLQELAKMSRAELDSLEMITKRRRKVMGTAATVMIKILEYTQALYVVFSGCGVREGLLYTKITEAEQHEDPLLARCRQMEAQLSRFNNGQAIYTWSQMVTEGEKPEYNHLYHAICMLNDVSWFEHRDYRAELIYRRVLTQRFGGGVNHKERALMAIALFVSYGGDLDDALIRNVRTLLSYKQLKIAERFGITIRLARRLGGGPVEPLNHAKLEVKGQSFKLKIDESLESFMGEHIEKLMKKLADNMNLQYKKPKIYKTV
ncbi:MAG: hypothetical protein ACK5MJ_07155 [Alphaproteobacteria bacterium]